MLLALTMATKAPPNKWLVAISVTFGTLMGTIDASIVNVATPHLRGSLGATVEEITWVSTGFIIANVIVMPLTAFLGRLFGQKRIYMIALTLFVIGSAFCGLARSLPMLVVFRFFQGLGAGALQPTEQAILRQTFPPKEQGMAMALFGVAVVIGPAFGPTLGGYIVDNYTWPWIFYINLPVGALALFMVSHVRPRAGGHPRREPRPGREAAKTHGLGRHRAPHAGRRDAPVRARRGQKDDWFESPVITACAAIVGGHGRRVRHSRAHGRGARREPVALQRRGLHVGHAHRRGDVRDADLAHVPLARLHARAARLHRRAVGHRAHAARARR